MSVVDLNIDLGELPNEPRELYAAATVANVACGGHAGDAASMARAVSFALARGVRVAAHPSYPDREGFGRVSMAIEPGALAASIEAQCAALQKIATRLGAPARSLKPHGALYHDAHRDPVVARALLDGAIAGLGADDDLVVVGFGGGALEAEARARGLVFAREGFADRAYAADGSLVPRGQAGAVLGDARACARQAIALASTGRIETVCVHGDTQGAVDIALAVRDALAGAGMLAGAAGAL
ncbi:MAG TPA: LamB/YcsF family protein [Byssovorax sp.]